MLCRAKTALMFFYRILLHGSLNHKIPISGIARLLKYFPNQRINQSFYLLAVFNQVGIPQFGP